MKVIGLIGGMSWESSAEYYRIINQEVRCRLGPTHSAKSIMWSMDFAEIEKLQHEGNWQQLSQLMINAAQNLQRGGAEFLVICTNTMHRMAHEIITNTSIPLLHIADPTAQKIKTHGYSTVGLLGTAFTMEQDFYKGRLATAHGLNVLTPEAQDRKIIHDIIYNELISGDIKDTSREKYKVIIQKLANQGAQAIILGCTEIMLLISQQDSPVPIFDTTTLHAIAAVEYALSSTTT